MVVKLVVVVDVVVVKKVVVWRWCTSDSLCVCQATVGAPSCALCPSGAYTAATGAASCAKCPLGTYQVSRHTI